MKKRCLNIKIIFYRLEVFKLFVRLKSLFTIKGYSLFVICMLLVGIGNAITQPYLSLYSTENLGMSVGSFGFFIAVSSLSGVLVNSFIAKRSDSGLNRKSIILYAMISSAIAYSSFLWFHNFLVLLIIYTIFSGLGAPSIPQIYASSQEAANENKLVDKIFAMSVLRSLISLGFVIGPLVGTFILGFLGYKGLFLGTSFIYLFIALFVFLFLQRRKTVLHPVTKKDAINTSLLKNRDLRHPFIAFILLITTNAINAVNTPLFIVNALHGTHTDVGVIVSISAGLEIPIMLVCGSLGKKISNHSLMIFGCLVVAIYFLILSVSTNTWEVLIAQIFEATFVAIAMGNGLSYFTDLLPDFPGLSTTLYTNASTIGKLIGSLGSGLLAQFIGFRFVNLVIFAIVIIAFFILWGIKPHSKIELNV